MINSRIYVALILSSLVHTTFFAAGIAAAGQVYTTSFMIEHGPRSSNKVAITFDACPTSRENDYDKDVIDVLEREMVPATLFLSGRWVKKNIEAVRRLSSIPQFEIANHSYHHPHMTDEDDERIIKELRRTQSVIREAIGKTPRLFRPPFGEVDDRLITLAAEEGLVTVQYDVASGDPDPNLSADKIVRNVLAKAKGGSIIVFHMNNNGILTAETLPQIIEGLRSKGFILTTVGDMLQTTATMR